MANTEPWVFMGGTFDPVHNGHLRTALELRQWLQVSRVCLLPSRVPVHREQPGCSPEQPAADAAAGRGPMNRG